MKRRHSYCCVMWCLLVALLPSGGQDSALAGAAPFRVEEATITAIQAAFEAGTLTAEQLVHLYLVRIQQYDKKGPRLNSIITVNPRALATARQLDLERQRSGPRGPLHGIPILLKDNYDTFDMPTTAGSLALAGSLPPDDAFVTRKLREAGAIILGKTNLDEFAAGSITYSSLGGQTLNPYDTTRIPGGSSGGTATAIAANLATVGLGSETLGSVRKPAFYQSLVGFRTTVGVVSRAGMIPLTKRRDGVAPTSFSSRQRRTRRTTVPFAVASDSVGFRSFTIDRLHEFFDRTSRKEDESVFRPRV